MKTTRFLASAAAALLFSIHALSAQDFKCTSWEAYPKGVKEARTQHTLYRDQFKNKQYAEALKLWEPLFESVTSPEEAKKRHFDDGISIYSELAKLTQDAAQKKAYLDKMNTLYDHKAKCIGEDLTDRAYQAYNLQAGGYPDAAATLAAYERVLDMGKEKTPYFSLQPTAMLSVYMFGKAPKYDKAFMVALYYRLKEICEKNNTAEYQQAWTAVDAEFKKIEAQIFDCSYYEEQIRPQFKANPNDAEKNKQFLQQLKNRCAEETPLYKEIFEVYQKQIVAEREAKFDELFETADPYTKGLMLESRDQKDEANKWFEKAFDDPKNGFPAEFTSDDKGKLAYRIAHRYYSGNSYGTARSWCRRASDYKPNWGEPYILVGMMYASSGKLCGPGTGWDSQVVAWAAMDEWNKAKSVDAGAASEANRLIGKYREYIPTVSEGHFRNLKEGDPYKVGCWIGVTTTCRFKK